MLMSCRRIDGTFFHLSLLLKIDLKPCEWESTSEPIRNVSLRYNGEVREELCARYRLSNVPIST